MKTKSKLALVLGITSIAALPIMARPGVGVGVFVSVPAPAPVVVVPAPVVTIATPNVAVTVGAVPDTYVWDGYEYVGFVGGVYYYLGPHNYWVPMDQARLARFNVWQRGHANWQAHATQNMNYRHDAHGHNVPRQNHGQYQH